MEEWIKMIGNVGFPIVVTLYLLHRIESKLEGVIVAIEKAPAAITKVRRSSGIKIKFALLEQTLFLLSGITTIYNNSLSRYTFSFFTR